MKLLRRAFATLTVLLGAATPSSAWTPRLVEDLGDHLPAWAGSQPYALATIGARVSFLAQPADDSGIRLYATDGTTSGTRELPTPGMDGSATTGLLAGTLDALAIYELRTQSTSYLWATDGSESGTQLLHAASGAQALSRYDAPHVAAVRLGSTLLFFMKVGGWDGPLELWGSRGTAQTTRRLSDFPQELTDLRAGPVATGSGIAFFVLSDPGGSPQALWRTEESGGTFELTPVSEGCVFYELIALETTALLVESSGSSETLWASDGWQIGTGPIADLAGIRRFEWRYFATDGRTALYTRDGEASGLEIWLSRGDAETTRLVATISDYSPQHYGDDLAPFATFAGGRGLLSVIDAGQRLDLWSIDPESGTTAQIATIGTPDHRLADAVSGGDWAYFALFEDEGRSTIWRSDGTSAGTARLFQATEAGAWEGPRLASPLTDRLLFTFRHEDTPTLELWSTDGTPAGTVLLDDSLSQTWRGEPFSAPPARDLAAAGLTTLFPAADAVCGWELWGARGAEAARVADLRLDRAGVDWLVSIGEIEEELLFGVADAFTDRWKIRSVPLAESGSRLLFERPHDCSRHGCNVPRAVYPLNGRRLYLEQGAELGPSVALGFDPATGETENLFPSDGASYGLPLSMDAHPSAGKLVFLAERNARPGIFATDGTRAGTRRIVELNVDSYYTSLGRLEDRWVIAEINAPAARILAFDLQRRQLTTLVSLDSAWLDQTARTRMGLALSYTIYLRGGKTRRQAWWTDGTQPGTRLALDLPGSPNSSLGSSAEASTFLLSTYDADSGTTEVWASDGSPERTRRLLELPDSLGGLASPLVLFRGEIYFPLSAVSAGQQRLELWRTDGSAENTLRLVSLPSAAGSSYLTDLEPIALRDRVLFVGHDPDHGLEPWATDGTPEGTALLADLEPGPASSTPGPFARFGDRVVFAATTSAEGRELWSVGGIAAPEIVADLFPGPASSAPEIVGVFGDHLLFLGDDGVVGHELWSLDGAGRDPCVPSAGALCLSGGRFRVSARWREFVGRLGEATAVPLTADSGYFWFFDAANPELLVKVLDACATEAHNYWVFTTGLTDVEVTLDVQDSGSGETRRFETRLGEPFLAAFDAGSFRVCPERRPAATAPAAAASLGTLLPLLGGRFEAEASWRYPGASGVGEAVALSDQAGYFWFFHPDNVELLVKVLDGCPLQPYPAYWVFAGGLTDLEVVLTVRDLFTGRVYSVATPGGIPFPPVLDAGAFATCP